MNPLRDITDDLVEKIASIEGRINTEHEQKMKGWFRYIQSYCEHRASAVSEENFIALCHYEGIFSMNALYQSTVYFSYARKIREISPFSELDKTYDGSLRKHIINIREVVDGPDGVYKEYQDILGTYVDNEDGVINYAEFCCGFQE